jgi:hypothetical protein
LEYIRTSVRVLVNSDFNVGIEVDLAILIWPENFSPATLSAITPRDDKVRIDVSFEINGSDRDLINVHLPADQLLRANPPIRKPCRGWFLGGF